ncbi:iron ABC transporter, partial [Escherichia coli]|nr:iron ABC transporter [Escherichia coli]
MSRRVTVSLWLLAALLSLLTFTATGFGALSLPVSLLWNRSDEALRQIWLTTRL